MQDFGLNPIPVELESALYQDPQMTHILKSQKYYLNYFFQRHRGSSHYTHAHWINCFKNPFMYNSNMGRIDIDKYV